MSSETGQPKRPYDPRRRRERAAEERLAMRNRVIEAATNLFISKGFTATTMADIARDAGVAMQSVYAAGRSKGDLLRAAVERAVAGDDEDVMVHDRSAAAQMAQEPDPVRQVEIFVGAICDIQERSEPIQMAFREAAAIDEKVAAAVELAHRQRRETFGMVIGLIPPNRLRHPVTECADTAWAVASTESVLLLRNVLGWSWSQVRAWLGRTLSELLLTPEQQ